MKKNHNDLGYLTKTIVLVSALFVVAIVSAGAAIHSWEQRVRVTQQDVEAARRQADRQAVLAMLGRPGGTTPGTVFRGVGEAMCGLTSVTTDPLGPRQFVIAQPATLAVNDSTDEFKAIWAARCPEHLHPRPAAPAPTPDFAPVDWSLTGRAVQITQR